MSQSFLFWFLMLCDMPGKALLAPRLFKNYPMILYGICSNRHKSREKNRMSHWFPHQPQQ